MTTIDLFFFCLICFGVLRGLFKGFIVEIASIVSILIGGYGAIRFSNNIATILIKSLNWSISTITIFSFIITFTGIVLAILIAAKLTTKLFNLMSLGIINRIIGGIFGGLKISLILSILLLFLNQFKIDKAINLEDKLQESILYHYIKDLAPGILPSYFDFAEFKQFFDSD